MSGTTYDVRVWTLRLRKNNHGKVTSYGVRWGIAGRQHYESFKTRAQAESFRAKLLSAARDGEAFAIGTGLPVSMSRGKTDMSWFDFACTYVDMKWETGAATSRQGVAEALIRVTPALTNGRGRPDDKTLRSVLRQWAFNAERRNASAVPQEAKTVMKWCSRNTVPVSSLAQDDQLRKLERASTRQLNGEPFSGVVARKTRNVLSNALDYAVEIGALQENPLKNRKWATMPKQSNAVDRRSVPNPVQARTLLNSVAEVKRSGPRLVAFFALMYFAAARPEEAAEVRLSNLTLPTDGWGEVYLEQAAPHAGSAWTDDGSPRDQRHLKARARGEGRPVPCPPELVTHLQKHLASFGVGKDGRIFHGEQGGQIPMITYTRVWRAARAATFTLDVLRTPLARRPYDLRHAAVSTWLNAGVPVTTVAKWAGHSVSVLLSVYAACLHGQDEAARKQVEQALGQQR